MPQSSPRQLLRSPPLRSGPPGDLRLRLRLTGAISRGKSPPYSRSCRYARQRSPREMERAFQDFWILRDSFFPRNVFSLDIRNVWRIPAMIMTILTYEFWKTFWAVFLRKENPDENREKKTEHIPETSFHNALVGILRRYPDLGLDGFLVDGATGFDRRRHEMTSKDVHLKAFEAALSTLKALRPVRNPNTGSYALKHYVEEVYHHDRIYCANGILIAAALYLEMPIKRLGPRSPNALIAVSAADLRRSRKRLRNRETPSIPEVDRCRA